MNLVSLVYFLTSSKTQFMDLNALLSEKIETIFLDMTRYSLLYLFLKNFFCFLLIVAKIMRLESCAFYSCQFLNKIEPHFYKRENGK